MEIPKEMVRNIAGARVEFSRTPKNLGIAGCWNECIEQGARRMGPSAAPGRLYPAEGFIKNSPTQRRNIRKWRCSQPVQILSPNREPSGKPPNAYRNWKRAGRTVERFFYGTPVQCPGVVVKKSFYEAHGGFHPELVFVLDCEMWARVVGIGGGLVVPDVLACYRSSDGGATRRLERTAENLRDVERLNAIFTERYPGFSRQRALQRICYRAKDQAELFSKNGDAEAVRANLEYWNEHATPTIRARRFVGKYLRGLR